MGYLKNKELLDYYPDRQVWLVERGDPTGMILPYDQATAPLKLAYDYANHGANSALLAGTSRHSTLTDPASVEHAENIAARSR
jgi:hypothetical protein